jgi:FixJ family two-component response regulator
MTKHYRIDDVAPDLLANVAADAVEQLTDKQRVVCALIGRGLPSKKIAEILDMSLRAVEKCRHDAATAIDIDTHSLVIWAARNTHRLPTMIPQSN